MSMPITVGQLLQQALVAYGTLAGLAEEVEDEWTYVTELQAAWQARLEMVADERQDAAAEPAVQTAIARAIEEVGLIRDPHRAIDWLSTFPQVVLAALGERA